MDPEVINGLIVWRDIRNPTANDVGHSVMVFARGAADGPSSSRATGVNVYAGDDVTVREMAVIGIKATTPIEIETDGEMWETGTHVILHHSGNVADNWWTITKTGDKTATLDGSRGEGVYLGGGRITNAPMLYGLSVEIAPRVDRNRLGDGHPATNGDDAVGIALWNAGPGEGTELMYAGRNAEVFPDRPEVGQVLGVQTWCSRAAITLAGRSGMAAIDCSLATVDSGIALQLGPGQRIGYADTEAYTIKHPKERRTLDVTKATTREIAEFVTTLVADLQAGKYPQ